jgi:hypothetical protein
MDERLSFVSYLFYQPVLEWEEYTDLEANVETYTYDTSVPRSADESDFYRLYIGFTPDCRYHWTLRHGVLTTQKVADAQFSDLVPWNLSDLRHRSGSLDLQGRTAYEAISDVFEQAEAMILTPLQILRALLAR